MVAHHATNNAWYRDRLIAHGSSPRDIGRLNMAALPLIARQDIIVAGESFFSSNVPKSHGTVGESKSSGSTGEPVVVRCTDIVGLFFNVINCQETEWQKRDVKRRLSVVRASKDKTAIHDTWGSPTKELFGPTGPLQVINNNTDIREMGKMISDFDTEILMCYPSVMMELIDYWLETDTLPPLKHYKSIGETVTDRLRARVMEVFALPVEDVFSSQELGTIAQQCDRGSYHTMDYNLIVEILDDKDRHVAPGQSGRVVVTDLHNFASPLIRYDTGDWAVKGKSCACGRGLATMERIQGRTRNLILRADGTRYWPMVGMYNFHELSFRIRRYQVIQVDRETMEYHVVVDEPLDDAQMLELEQLARRALGEEFRIQVKQHLQAWPEAPNHKREEFICRAV